MNIDNSSAGHSKSQDELLGRPVYSNQTWPSMLAGFSKSVHTLAVTAPFDGGVIADVPVSSQSDIDRALQIAYQHFRDKSCWISLAERIGILERTARMMTRDHSQLALLASRESGKPIADSLVEVTHAIDTVRLAINELRSSAGEVVPAGASSESHGSIALSLYEPIGVVIALSDFNHPFTLVVQEVAAAVAAGCPVIIKPSEQTPLSCLCLVNLLWSAGLPKAWVQAVITPDNRSCEWLVKDERVGFLSYLGSSRTGWNLRSKLAPGAHCFLHHGGTVPVVIAPDADYERALSAIIKGGYYHAGQVCVSVQRVYVPAAKVRAFAQALVSEICKLKLGDPCNSATQIGPLIRPAEVARVHRWVKEAIADGAECLCGGSPSGTTLYECTVLLNPPADAKVSRREIFGPVLCIYDYEDIEEAYRAANDTPSAVQAAVFTRDIEIAVDAYDRLNASEVRLNDHKVFQPAGMRFSGWRESRPGVGGMAHSIRTMTTSKTLVINTKR